MVVVLKRVQNEIYQFREAYGKSRDHKLSKTTRTKSHDRSFGNRVVRAHMGSQCLMISYYFSVGTTLKPAS